MSLGLTKMIMQAEYKQINKKLIFENLIIRSIQRQSRYAKLHFDSDLGNDVGFSLNVVLFFSPHILRYMLSNNFDAAAILHEYDETLKEKKKRMSTANHGLD
jgi:hypothetical protein